jgi:DNA-binding MarR family transcriptional regulator
MTRQGAGKIVTSLRDRGYVTLTASATSGREKNVQLTERATDYLAARRNAARRIEQQLRDEIGADGVDSLHRLLGALGGGEQPRLSDYLRETGDVTALADLE